jgi:hypothetical protein
MIFATDNFLAKEQENYLLGTNMKYSPAGKKNEGRGGVN